MTRTPTPGIRNWSAKLRYAASEENRLGEFVWVCYSSCSEKKMFYFKYKMLFVMNLVLFLFSL